MLLAHSYGMGGGVAGEVQETTRALSESGELGSGFQTAINCHSGPCWSIPSPQPTMRIAATD